MGRTTDAQLRSAKASETEWKRKAEAMQSECERHKDMIETLQGQLRSAVSQADGSLASLRELEGLLSVAEAENGRVKGQLEREKDEHAGTKRALQRVSQESADLAQEVQQLVREIAKVQQLLGEISSCGTRLVSRIASCPPMKMSRDLEIFFQPHHPHIRSVSPSCVTILLKSCLAPQYPCFICYAFSSHSSVPNSSSPPSLLRTTREAWRMSPLK